MSIDAPAVPRNRRELISIFGDPGQGIDPDPEWYRENIVSCHERGQRPALPLQPVGRWAHVHHIIEPVLRATLDDVDAEVGPHISVLGTHCHRHQRHDPSLPLSLHSWGIAIDIDPRLNQARRFAPGKCPAPWSERWKEIWPHGLSEELVEIFESRGWRWGGRWAPWADPMHFQWSD